MPRIEPNLQNVQWPRNEGAIGVVGLAPWATVDFISQVYENTSASKDWHFPRLIVDANSKIPSRGRYFDLGETDPSPAIAETIAELIAAGANAVVVPCNTAHILFDRWSISARDSIVSIIDATLAELPDATNCSVAVLGSSHLTKHRIYLNPLAASGRDCHAITDEQQGVIGKIIAEIKVTNALTERTASDFAQLLVQLQRTQAGCLVLGCTELAQAMRCLPSHGYTGEIIDSNGALARAALTRIA